MTERDPAALGDYILAPANAVDEQRLAAFAAAVWPDRPITPFMSSWWRRAAAEHAVAVIHRVSGSVAATCAGRPSQWIIGGKRHGAVAICDWYVAPGHGGRLIGRRLLRNFIRPDRLVYGYSLSDVAIQYVRRLGWVGPFRSTLLLLPLPQLALLARAALARRDGLSTEEYRIVGSELPRSLSDALDNIEARRAHKVAHMMRGSDEWSWRLGLLGSDRHYLFCVVSRNGAPAGYVAVRRTLPRTSRLLGRLPAALVSDVVAVDDDTAVLRRLAACTATLAGELGAAVALAASTEPTHWRAFAAVGYLSSELPVIGPRLLAPRAPEYIWLPRGPGADLVPGQIAMTLSDSDVDLKL